MTKTNAIDFVNELNNLVSKFEITPDKEFLKNILLPKQINTNINLTGDFLVDLFNNYELSERTIVFDFHNKLEINSTFIFFATSDIFSIGQNIESEEIIMFDLADDEVYIKLAKDLNEFIEVILLIFNYELEGWINNKTYLLKDRKSILSEIKKCISPEYLQYYEVAYGS